MRGEFEIRARGAVAASLVALAAWILAPAVAHAGTYKMYTCSPPGAFIAHPSKAPWRLYSENNSGVQDLSNCPGVAGGALAMGFPLSGSVHPMGRVSKAGFELPAGELNAGVSIAKVQSWITSDIAVDPNMCQFCFQPAFPDGLGPNASAGGGGSDPGLTTPYDPPVPLVRFGLSCGDGAAGAGCNLLRTPNVTIAGTIVDLVEAVAPVATITGGSLASVGTKAGSATLSYTATDGQSGVARADVLLDGVVAGSQDFSRDVALPLAQQGSGPCVYTGIAACPLTETGDINADTSKVADGIHAVTLRVTDAAGNVKDLAGTPVTVSNAAAGGAGSGPNGTNASRLAKLSARFAATKRRTYRVKFKSSPTIRGQLADEHGQAIGGARLVILARLARAGARREQINVVTTAGDGAFSARVPAGPSRTLTVSYTAFGGDAKASRTASVRTSVRASVSVDTTSRTPRAGQRFQIAGRLNYLPRAGVQTFVQARNGTRWQTVGSPKTTRGGRFSWPYSFSRTGRGRIFAFRVRVDSVNYPFAPTTSRVIRVRVR